MTILAPKVLAWMLSAVTVVNNMPAISLQAMPKTIIDGILIFNWELATEFHLVFAVVGKGYFAVSVKGQIL